GAHSNVGGSYAPDGDGGLLSDIPLKWMLDEAAAAGLAIEPHLPAALRPVPTATLHRSRKHIYRSKPRFYRPIAHPRAPLSIHPSVKARWDADPGYRPKNLAAHLESHGWGTLLPRGRAARGPAGLALLPAGALAKIAASFPTAFPLCPFSILPTVAKATTASTAARSCRKSSPPPSRSCRTASPRPGRTRLSRSEEHT